MIFVWKFFEDINKKKINYFDVLDDWLKIIFIFNNVDFVFVDL